MPQIVLVHFNIQTHLSYNFHISKFQPISYISSSEHVWCKAFQQISYISTNLTFQNPKMHPKMPGCIRPKKGLEPIYHSILFCLKTPKDSSGSANFWTEPSLASLSAILFPHTLACPMTHCRDIIRLLALVPMEMFWRSEGLLEPPGCQSKYSMYLFGLPFVWIS